MTWGDNRWEHGAYLEPMSATYDAVTRHLSVVFRDGDQVRVAVDALRPSAHGAQWDKLRVQPRLHIRVPVAPEQGDAGKNYADITGHAIRLLTDSAFAAHWARAAEESARQLGAQLRALRTMRGLSAAELGARAGMPQQSVSRIENGQRDVTYTALIKILAAMGCTLTDLVDSAASRPESSLTNASA